MPFFRPYRTPRFDTVYNMLFADDPTPFAAAIAGGEPWTTLFAVPPNMAALRRLAESEASESRVRLLAFGMLREAGESVPPKLVLGAIIEAPQPEGLDVLAVYADYRVRYIHALAKLRIVEDAIEPLKKPIDEMMAASRALVAKIDPWSHPRQPPPAEDMARVTFLASDGLYLGQAPFESLRRDADGAPVIAPALEILNILADMVAPESD
jgi:hypothetical protein